MSEYQPDLKEQQRIIIATAIIALTAALFALPATGADLWSLTRGFTLLPGVLAFLFIVTTGSHLKYSEAGIIGSFNATHSIRKFLYNWMIDMFWIGAFLSVTFYTGAVLGWDGKQMNGSKFWLGLIVGSVIMTLITLGSLFLWFKENKKNGAKK